MKVKDVVVDGKVIRLSIWDTAGQERYQSITQQFYRNAHAIIYGAPCSRAQDVTVSVLVTVTVTMIVTPAGLQAAVQPVLFNYPVTYFECYAVIQLGGAAELQLHECASGLSMKASLAPA